MISGMTEKELASALTWFLDRVESGELEAPERLVGQLEGASAALEAI